MMRVRGSSREAERSKYISTSLSQDGDLIVKCKPVDLAVRDLTLEKNSVHFITELYDKGFEACPNTADSFLDVDIKNKQKCQEFLSKVEQPVTRTIQCGTVPEIYDLRTSTAEDEKATVGDTDMGSTVDTGVTSALSSLKMLGIKMFSREGKCCSSQEQRKCFPPQEQILQIYKIIVRHIHALILLALFVPVSLADPVYNKTQELPAVCMAQIKLMQQCPRQNLVYMTNLCCADFPGTDLHCQQAEAEGFVTWVFPACIKGQKVGGGVSVKLVINNTAYPILEFIRCLGWDDGYRMTYEVFEPCIPINTKIDCSFDKGRQMLCNGGGNQDDKCVCAPDYEPVVYNKVCLEGFDSNDPWCGCVYKPCSEGYYRNITIPLKATCDGVVPTAFNYTCIPIPNSTLTISALEGTTEIADAIVTNVLLKITTSSDVRNKTTDDLVGLWGLVLCGVVLVSLLIYCV